MRSTKAIINLKAIKHNLSILQKLAPNSNVMPVLKANAYGHGIVQVAQTLTDAQIFGVAFMAEAIELRKAKITQPIVLLEGAFCQDELTQALELNLQLVIHQKVQLEDLLTFAKSYTGNKKLTIWLKLNTGMNRLGLSDSDFLNAHSVLKKCSLVKEIISMSHLACADDIKSPMTDKQIKTFKKVTQDLTTKRSLANSAGIIAWPETHFDWIRPGLSLYGCSPMAGLDGLSHQFLPTMTLQSELLSIQPIKSGESVGYSCGWIAKQQTRVGIVAIGYADGYPRHAPEGTPILIKGKNYPLVGVVCMDMLTVDLGIQDEFEIGDHVTLWGEGLGIEIIAKQANTIAHTLLCGVTSRVPFEWH